MKRRLAKKIARRIVIERAAYRRSTASKALDVNYAGRFRRDHPGGAFIRLGY